MDWFPLWNSLRIAAISTVIIFFAGIFAAYYIAKLPRLIKGVLDVVLTLPLAAAGASDDLAATVNYAEVFALARSVVEGAPCRLIEAVAERIARGVLARFARVEAVRVTVHKPAAPLPGVFHDAAVTIVRARDAEARA